MDIKCLNEMLSKTIDEVFVPDDFFTSAELDKIAIELRHGESSGIIGLKDWAISIYVTGKDGNDGEFVWLSEPLRTETLSSIADEVESNNVEDFIDLAFTPTTISEKLSVEATAKKYPYLVEEIDGNYYWQVKFVLEGSSDESLDETKEVLPIECAKEYTKEELDKIDGELKFVKTDTHLLGASEIPLNNPVHVYQFFFKGIDKHANLETIDNKNFQCVGIFKNKCLNEMIVEALEDSGIKLIVDSINAELEYRGFQNMGLDVDESAFEPSVIFFIRWSDEFSHKQAELIREKFNLFKTTEYLDGAEVYTEEDVNTLVSVDGKENSEGNVTFTALVSPDTDITPAFAENLATEFVQQLINFWDEVYSEEMLKDREINEDFKANKVRNAIKEEITEDKGFWTEFEWRIAEYLKDKGITEKIESYTAQHGEEIVDDVLNEFLDEETDREQLIDLWYSCPIFNDDIEDPIFTEMKKSIIKALPRCLSIGDKVFELSKEQK